MAAAGPVILQCGISRDRLRTLRQGAAPAYIITPIAASDREQLQGGRPEAGLSRGTIRAGRYNPLHCCHGIGDRLARCWGGIAESLARGLKTAGAGFEFG